MLLSTLMTSVTCGPRYPGATRNSSVSPVCMAPSPICSSAAAWRKTGRQFIAYLLVHVKPGLREGLHVTHQAI